ncbi:MAG: hypothetical protein Q8M92_09845, partial [Candidatus Subteraquimicrobiales bacterium]|nr:hypothetical protein [Candidatus Subteraquimicrobiales bacterium]
MMAKICILSTVNLKHMTLVSLYTDFFDKNNIRYDIIYIDKYFSDEENTAENVYKLNLSINKDWTFFYKLIKYWKFKKYAKEIIESKNYEFIIVWNSFTAFMFSDLLLKQYNGNYCINIRDYAKEKFYPVYRVLKKVIENSSFTTISSDGFKKFLPEFD